MKMKQGNGGGLIFGFSIQPLSLFPFALVNTTLSIVKSKSMVSLPFFKNVGWYMSSLKETKTVSDKDFSVNFFALAGTWVG